MANCVPRRLRKKDKIVIERFYVNGVKMEFLYVNDVMWSAGNPITAQHLLDRMGLTYIVTEVDDDKDVE